MCTMNARILHGERVQRRTPFVLAVSHLSHVEPFLVAAVVRRPIDFIARIEFYRYRVLAWMLRRLNAIKVNRTGVAANTIRTAISRLANGRIVGIFPEGGVTRGEASVCLGGPIKLGVAMIANNANVPVIPSVVLGTHELNRVAPWLPFKHAHIWMVFGEPIAPVASDGTRAGRRAARAELGGRISAAMQALYRELCQTYDLKDMAGETYAEAATASDDEPREPRTHARGFAPGSLPRPESFSLSRDPGTQSPA